jgi:hypothetical protein
MVHDVLVQARIAGSKPSRALKKIPLYFFWSQGGNSS